LLCARNAVAVSVACAVAGIIVGVVGLTGLGLQFSAMMLACSGGSLLLVLLLVIVAAYWPSLAVEAGGLTLILAVLGMNRARRVSSVI
jgi:hypothetical protein